jgi:hypothetical protein
MTPEVDDTASLGAGLSASQRLELERAIRLAREVRNQEAAVRQTMRARDVQIVRAIDFHQIDPARMAKATGISPVRINQILAEQG